MSLLMSRFQWDTTTRINKPSAGQQNGSRHNNALNRSRGAGRFRNGRSTPATRLSRSTMKSVVWEVFSSICFVSACFLPGELTVFRAYSEVGLDDYSSCECPSGSLAGCILSVIHSSFVRLIPWLGCGQAIFFRTACATCETHSADVCFGLVAARTFDGLCSLCLFGLAQ